MEQWRNPNARLRNGANVSKPPFAPGSHGTNVSHGAASQVGTGQGGQPRGQRLEMCQEAAPRKGTGVGLQARLGFMGIMALAISMHFKREALFRFILNWDNNGQMQMVLVEWDIQPNGAFPGGNHKHPIAGVPPHALDLVEIGQGFCTAQERQPREPESCGGWHDYSLWAWRVPAAGAQPHCLVFMAREVFRRGLCMAAWVGFVPSWVCLH